MAVPPLPSNFDPALTHNNLLVAVAVKIYESKPITLIVSDYLAHIRARIAHGQRSFTTLSQIRFLDGCEFWRVRANEQEKRVLELQAQIMELEAGNLASVKTVEKRKGEAFAMRAPKKLKRQTLACAKIGKKQEIASPTAEETLSEHLLDLFGSEAASLQRSLQLLSLLTEPHQVVAAITRTTTALANAISSLSERPSSTAPVSTTSLGTRNSKIKAMVKIATKEAFLTTVTLVLETISTTISNKLTARISPNYIVADASIAVISLLLKILKTVRLNIEVEERVEDYRVELVRSLLFFLCPESIYEEGEKHAWRKAVLHGFCIGFFGLIQESMARLSLSLPESGMSEEWCRERVFIEESGWYWLWLLKNVWPAFETVVENKKETVWGKKVVESLEWGSRGKVGIDKVEFLVESPFMKGVVGVMGWRIFEAHKLNGL